MTPSWYDVLGVDKDATTDEIRAAWQEAIAGLDPTDRRFKQRNRAAEVLLDDRRRAAHDADLAAAEAEEQAEPGDDADAADDTGPSSAGDPEDSTDPGPGTPSPTAASGGPSSERSLAGALTGRPETETRPRPGRGRGPRTEGKPGDHATARIKALGRTDGPATDGSAPAEEGAEATPAPRRPGRSRTAAAAPATQDTEDDREAPDGDDLEVVDQAEDGTGDPEAGGTDEAAVSRAGRRGVGWRTAVVASVVALALLVATVVSLALGRDETASALPDDRQVAAAQRAAESAIGPILSYDYRSLDQSREAAVSFMTPSYAATYEQNFDAIVAENAEQTKTIVTAQVVTSGIVRTGADRVDVLVFVNRPTRNAQGDDVSRDQVTVRMLDSGGRWLVDCLITEPGGTCG